MEWTLRRTSACREPCLPAARHKERSFSAAAPGIRTARREPATRQSASGIDDDPRRSAEGVTAAETHLRVFRGSQACRQVLQDCANTAVRFFQIVFCE